MKIVLFLLLTLSLYSKTITKEQCETNQEEFIYAGGECINFFLEEGDADGILNIIIHGAWKEGSNTLARYTPFAQTIAMNTDISTIAIALPAYSKSSSNKLKALMSKNKDAINASTSKEYIDFLVSLIQKFKIKYKAKTINIIAHSAGAILSGTITGYKPNLIQNIVLAGGQYDLRKFKNKDAITINKYINNIPKSTNFLLIYGTDDKISKPKITKDFYKILKQKNINVKILEVKNHKHIDLDMSEQSIDAIGLMLMGE